MKKLLLSTTLATICFFSFSQKGNNIWYFGDHAGLDFNSGSPVALTNSAMFTYDNCTSVADPTTGSLLFYSNGVDVWNKNHSVMPNGSGLLGSTSGGNSAYAVRQPGSTSVYYLFTMDAFAGPNGLRYSIVDLSLQGGNGDVTSTKNVQLLNPSTEKITAVKHSNNLDVWIIAHPWNSNSFYAYLLSSTGLSTTPVISTIGSTHAGGTLGTYNACGQIAATASGNKIVVAIYDLQVYELFDFDKSTGAFSNLITISGHPRAWGAEFSSDGSKLYTTEWGGAGAADLYQFDLSSNNQSTINSSATVIGTVTSPDGNYKAGYLQLAPDNKIYVTRFTADYLGVISSPNTSGSACNYIDNGIYLAGKICQAGLPSCLQFRGTEGGGGVNDYAYYQNNISVYPNPLNSTARIEINKSIVTANTRAELFDIYGRKVRDISELNTNPYIEKHDLAPGTYLLKVYNSAELFGIKKIIIQ